MPPQIKIKSAPHRRETSTMSTRFEHIHIIALSIYFIVSNYVVFRRFVTVVNKAIAELNVTLLSKVF